MGGERVSNRNNTISCVGGILKTTASVIFQQHQIKGATE